MKKTALVLLTAALLGFGAVATSGPALADGVYTWGPWSGFNGNGPVYSGEYAGPAYDSYSFYYEYPVYTGGDVAATAVDLFNSRFHHRRVVGPGVVYYRGLDPRGYRISPYW